ncbi:Zinc finger BED domain-containing protein 1 [Merluccius polli]|uniref:Zinc finger BED domain-containing protein 1 n=1 Tax=Merluccius polli TaxID=89951 RepID=A0AA47MX71_MERPO|nr:Zinc finger BED domain-containing protein 1 [Merluccius polli]
MVVKDLQPFTIVEDQGFRAFVNKLEPNYVLPSRKALTEMVDEKYTSTKETVKAEVQKAVSVSLTADMWTSINTESYLGVTCHYISPQDEMTTYANVELLEEWGITSKVHCMVTDNAANMALSVNLQNLYHLPCFAHTLNLIVKKAVEETPQLHEIRLKARKIIGLFRSSCKAREKLLEMQTIMGRPALKLIQDVETRWNSTYDMLQRLHHEKDTVAASLSQLNTDHTPLNNFEYEVISECLALLRPFKMATVELSEEERVSASNLIPLYRMIQHKLAEKMRTSTHHPTFQLGTLLRDGIQARCGGYETSTLLTFATLLDPRLKSLAFGNSQKAQDAEQNLIRECASLMRAATPGPQASTPPPPPPSPSAASAAASRSPSAESLWDLFDHRVNQTAVVHSATADATVEVREEL